MCGTFLIIWAFRPFDRFNFITILYRIKFIITPILSYNVKWHDLIFILSFSSTRYGTHKSMTMKNNDTEIELHRFNKVVFILENPLKL